MFRVECGGVIGREGREARWVAGFGIVGLSGLDRWRTGSATHNLLWIGIWETMGGNGQNNSQKGQLAFNLHISANSIYLQLRYVNENELICVPILDLHVYSNSQLTPRVGTSNSSYQLSRANTHRPIPSIKQSMKFWSKLGWFFP